MSPLSQRDGPSLYTTLHGRKVDNSTIVKNGSERVPVPAGWQIADGTADDIRVCGADPWQSICLVFANGDGYITSMASPSDAGACLQLLRWEKMNS